MNRKFFWGIFILLLVNLSACSSNQSKIDDGLLTGKPCSAPCWNNLTPGKSTAADVDNFLKNLSTLVSANLNNLEEVNHSQVEPIVGEEIAF